MPIRGLKRDLAAIAVLAALALLFFWPVTMGGRTMLPVDSVYAWEPWRSTAGAEGVGVAHNSLVLDLYLQNYAWKSFIVDCLRAGELPLWNPYILSGVPFLAGGQHSAMYPLSAVFYVLPLEAAYGWFAALHVFLAGAFTYILARTLRVSRAGSLIAGAAFSFGGFMVIRNVFPMIVAAAVWLPLILAVVEVTVRRAEEGTASPMGAIPLLAVGAAALGMVLLAGTRDVSVTWRWPRPPTALWRLVGNGAASLWRRSGCGGRAAVWHGGRGPGPRPLPVGPSLLTSPQLSAEARPPLPRCWAGSPTRPGGSSPADPRLFREPRPPQLPGPLYTWQRSM